MSSGVIEGVAANTRIARGTSTLVIGSSSFLGNVTVAGNQFSFGDLGQTKIDFTLFPVGVQNDVPYTIQLFNATLGVVESSASRVAPGDSAVPGVLPFTFVFNVTNAAHLYEIRIFIGNDVAVAEQANAINLQGITFRAIVGALQGGSGTGTYKVPVRLISQVNENIALLAAGSVIDGFPTAAGDRVLLAGQGAGADNGIYDIGAIAGTTVRSADFDTSAEVTSGVLIPVTEGATQDNTVWMLATNNPIVLGVTPLTFVKFGIATAWNSITDPVANQTLNMAAFTSTWNWTLSHAAGSVDELTMTVADGTSGTAGYIVQRINKTGAGTGSGLRQFSSYEVAGVPCFAVSVPAGLTGARNTVAGTSAGIGLTSGTDNTLYGDSAGVGAADSFATVMGSSALADAKGTAIGYNAEATAFSVGESALAVGYNAYALRGAVAVGEEAGSFAAYTTCIGSFAGASFSGFADIGAVCVGYKAGTAITSGTGNLMIGYFAGAALTTQKNNVFIGYEAGLGTAPFIVDTENVLIGYRAGTAIGLGFRNVHIGFESGKFCTGLHNVSLGVSTQAGASATGSDNTAIGSFSLNNCAGSQNTAVGRATGEAFTMTGADNALLGWRAGRVLTSGFSNTCVGSGSGLAQTTGSNNTFLGKSTDGPATLTGMLALGAGSTCTASNQWVVGSGTAAISDAYFGNGVTNAAPSNFAMHATGASGVDIAGAGLHIAAGQGTGTGIGGSLVLRVAQSGATGAALNALQTTLSINSDAQYALAAFVNTNAMPAGVEFTDLAANFARTLTFATGAIATQRSVVISAPTYAFVAASVITNAATFYISGAPIAGANATITNSYALWVDSGDVRIDGAQALGGGAAPTFGTIGGTGPAVAAQNEWLRIQTQNGVRFVPLWA